MVGNKTAAAVQTLIISYLLEAYCMEANRNQNENAFAEVLFHFKNVAAFDS